MAKSDVYVVTGSGGIGAACAQFLAKKGGILVLQDIKPELTKQVAEPLRAQGFKVEEVNSDISKEESTLALAQKVQSLGRFAGGVHTAGVSPRLGDWKRIFEINLLGTIRMINAFYPLAEPGTVMVCISSMSPYIAGIMGYSASMDKIVSDPLAPDFFEKVGKFIPPDPAAPLQKGGMAYAFSKRGVQLVVEKNAQAWIKKQARLFSMGPGNVDTPMERGDAEVFPDVKKTYAFALHNRATTPEEFAKLVNLLMSEDAGIINGVDILADDGVFSEIKWSKK